MYQSKNFKMEPFMVYIIVAVIVFLLFVITCFYLSMKHGPCLRSCLEVLETDHCHEHRCERTVYVVERDCERGPSNPCWTSWEKDCC
uniref:Late nodulin n=1 Tax=Steinernema glaseri TaxID=37863 RepID=A0A1I7Z8J2_9BILA